MQQVSRLTMTGRRSTLPPKRGRFRLPRRLGLALAGIEWRMPEHAGLKGAAALFIATAFAGMIAGDHVRTTIGYATAWCGLAVDSVRISGQSETSEIEVLDSLALGPHASIVTLDLGDARTRIEALPWVARATLQKVYPDTLKVAIEEKKPFALWQRGPVTTIIDERGAVIAPLADARYAGLPRVVGVGANERVHEVLDLVRPFTAIAGRMRGAVLVSERRWNIVLDDGVTILLPQDKPEEALQKLAAAEAKNGLLERDIVSVDLRLDDRLYVRLAPEAMKRRIEEIKAREKLAKKRGTDA